MSKNLSVVANGKGGVDMIVDKDAGNPVLITTGKASNSLEFWKRMQALSTQVVAEMSVDKKVEGKFADLAKKAAKDVDIQIELDDLVHQVHASMASSFNNQGPEAQIKWLLDHGCENELKGVMK